MKKLISILTACVMAVGISGLIPVSASAAKIKPNKVKIKSVKAVSTTAAKVSWKKVKKAKGYQIKVSTNKKFKRSKVVNIKKNTSKAKIKKLKANTKYFVKVRAYTKFGKKKVYGRWSKFKSVKTKQKKGPSPIPEATDDDWEPDDSNTDNTDYSEDDYYIEPEPEPTTQPTTLSKEEIEANKQKLSDLNEQLKAKYEKGNYLKLNNGENGKQIYSSRRWQDIEEQLKDNSDFINANLDSAEEWIYNQEAWDIRFELNDCFINDKPLDRESESDIYWGYTFDLNKYPELQEFLRSNPANITDDMTDIEKLEAIATYISEHGKVISWEERYGKGNTYAYDVPDRYKSFSMATQAYMVLIKDGTGVCIDFSAACCFWAGYYDISCLMISSSNIDHAWNRAILKDDNGIEGWYEIDCYPSNSTLRVHVTKVTSDLKSNIAKATDVVLNTVPIAFTNK